MRHLLAVVSILALAGCASRGTAEDYTWLLECPKTVAAGAEFEFAVRTVDPAGQAVSGVKFRYHILWTGGTYAPFRHLAASGAAVKLRAKRDTGPANLVVTCEDRKGKDTRVLETTFDVK
jgi:hypothetical protein